MRVRHALLAITILSIPVYVQDAQAQSADQLRAVVQSKKCPPNLTLFEAPSLRGMCGELKQTDHESLMESNRCISRFTKLDNAVFEYNQFIRRCNDTARSGSKKMNSSKPLPGNSSTGSPGSKWAQKTQQARRKAADKNSQINQQMEAAGKDSEAAAIQQTYNEQLIRERQQLEQDLMLQEKHKEMIARQIEADQRRDAFLEAERRQQEINSQLLNTFFSTFNNAIGKSSAGRTSAPSRSGGSGGGGGEKIAPGG